MNAFPKFLETYSAVAHLLFPPLALALIGLVGLVFKLVHSKTALKIERDSAKVACLDLERRHAKEIDELKAAHIRETNDLNTEIQNLRADKAALHEQLRPYIDRDLLCNGLELHQPSNTYVDPTTKIHYCLKCLELNPPVRLPMQDLGGSFKCPNCKYPYMDYSRC